MIDRLTWYTVGFCALAILFVLTLAGCATPTVVPPPPLPEQPGEFRTCFVVVPPEIPAGDISTEAVLLIVIHLWTEWQRTGQCGERLNLWIDTLRAELGN